jgi:type IV pilus assembly protein PilN
MIRINLLAPGQERVARSAAGLRPGQRAGLLCGLLIVGTALGLGWWAWNLSAESARLADELATAERETGRLQTLIQQVEQFERQRQQLQQRVSLIEELRKDQAGPVHLLDEISRALPEMLWLTQLKQEAAGELTIEGRCLALTALSDFVGNLEQSRYFARPVDIVNSQVSSAVGGADLITFTIRARFALPGAPSPVAPRAP